MSVMGLVGNSAAPATGIAVTTAANRLRNRYVKFIDEEIARTVANPE